MGGSPRPDPGAAASSVNWTLHILPEAEDELLAAAEWYDAREAGLGVTFVRTVDQALTGILTAPLASPLWQHGQLYRRHVLRRFPYSILFIAEHPIVEVTAIAHAKRKPGYWLNRIMPRP